MEYLVVMHILYSLQQLLGNDYNFLCLIKLGEPSPGFLLYKLIKIHVTVLKDAVKLFVLEFDVK